MESVYPEAHAWYVDLHEHPELSGHETRTAAALAGRLRNPSQPRLPVRFAEKGSRMWQRALRGLKLD